MTTAAVPKQYGLHINGQNVSAESGLVIERRGPGDGELVSVYAQGAVADVDRAVEAARAAFRGGGWSRGPGAGRAKVLATVGELIRRDIEKLARIEALESGKPIRQARDEMGWAAGLWDYAAGLARQLAGESYNTLGEQLLGWTLREPSGVVGLITPWNFPLLIISQKLPFALAAGCACIVKPSEMTSGTTLLLAELLREGGLPPGYCNVVTGLGDSVGQAIAYHSDIDQVSFTGSTAVGKKITVAAAGNLKRVSLELGGKNPQIVYADADLTAALDAVVFGVHFNAGQCCNSGSRLLLHRDVSDEFVQAIVTRSAQLSVGHPLDERTVVGAIINERQLEKIARYVENGRNDGARLLTGGKALAIGAGLYFTPTVFGDVRPEMAIAREEIFGPVLSIVRFDHPEEAIELANDSTYGLSASIWTRDIDRALAGARGIQAGTVWVNTFMTGPAELPFGGFRQSGWGRELGRQAVEHFTEVKTVQVHLGARAGTWG